MKHDKTAANYNSDYSDAGISIRCASAGAVVGLPIAALLWALILYLSH